MDPGAYLVSSEGSNQFSQCVTQTVGVPQAGLGNASVPIDPHVNMFKNLENRFNGKFEAESAVLLPQVEGWEELRDQALQVAGIQRYNASKSSKTMTWGWRV